MGSWDDLWSELDLWRDIGGGATFWWRDDDAVIVTPPLEGLLALGTRTGTPLALAVIPRDLNGTLAERLADEPAVAVLQHGWAHANHAPDDGRAEEYGPDRPMAERIDELAAGWHRLQPFARPLPVLVAPWNRMDPDLISYLPQAGLTGVSVLGPRPSAEIAPGVRCCNVHVDIMDWQGTGGFVGDAAALQQIIDHLVMRRSGACAVDEPTGLMTHHQYHDDGCWRFIETLLAETGRHPAVRWLDPERAFWP
jgi:hypothetical protein